MSQHLFLIGDVREQLRRLPAASVQTCVTSPPYFGLRNYGVEGQIGLEPTPEAFIVTMVEVFREVRRVLRDDGTLWLNLGDSYAGGGKPSLTAPSEATSKAGRYRQGLQGCGIKPSGSVKRKDLVGIPWRVALALQADGWYLRQDIIWSKPNAMPERVDDRCTKAHEYLFLLAKSDSYYFDHGAMSETAVNGGQRNKRSVWTVMTKPFRGAHFATFPPELIEPCVLAGSRPGDVVLDPFGGSGTTAIVAQRHGRRSVYVDLNPDYAEIARKRLAEEA